MFINKCMSKVFKHLLTQKMKRCLCLISLYTYISNKKNRSIELEKINEALHLTDNLHKQTLPQYQKVSEKLWRDRLDEDTVSKLLANLDDLDEFIKTIPSYLKYDKEEIIKKDVHVILTSCTI